MEGIIRVRPAVAVGICPDRNINFQLPAHKEGLRTMTYKPDIDGSWELGYCLPCTVVYWTIVFLECSIRVNCEGDIDTILWDVVGGVGV